MRPGLKDGLFVAVFIMLISLPALIRLVGANLDFEIKENRTKTSFPKFDPKHPQKTATTFEKYFNDNFGLRGGLLFANKALRYFVLKTSGSDAVVIGKNGWHFFREHPNLNELRNAKLFSEDGVRKWAKALQARSDFAKQHGAKYVFVLAPDTKTVYPDQLPAWIPAQESRSRTDQLFEELAAHTDVQFIDLRPTLKEVRDEPIYYRTDTHWTELGAFYAYQAIMAKMRVLFPEQAENFNPLPLSYFYIVPTTFSGDLAIMLGLQGLVTEETISLVPHTTWQATMRQGKYTERNFVTENLQRPHAPKLLLFRDSFVNALQAPLAEHFSTTRFRWSYAFERRHIIRDKPDIVIQIMVERMLAELKPQALN